MTQSGPGKFSWKDGDVFEGYWKRGSRCGKGTLFKADGSSEEQEWFEPPEANYAIKEPPKYPF